MTAARACLATLALLATAGLGPAVPVARAQDFPQVREIRAHRANWIPRSSRPIRRIVLHTSEGDEASCVHWFKNPSARVSAHYLVSKAGRITRFVPDMSIAYHARKYNSDSIGIENEGHAKRNGWTAAQYQALARLVRGLCDRYGIPRDRRFIIAHSEVPGAAKGDPGPYFDWARFMALVRGGSGSGAASAGGGLIDVVDASTAPAPAASGRSVVEVQAESLNVRGAPGGQILGHVHRGHRFVASAQAGGWTKIHWRGQSAWVSSAYVRRVAGTVDVVRVTALNVRAAPSTAAARLGKLAAGQAYHRLGRQGVWVLIQFDQRQAWVHSAYTRSGALP